MLAGRKLAGLHIGRVIHARPRLGAFIRWMRIVEARPDKKRFVLIGRLFDLGDSPVTSPLGVVELLGDIPRSAFASLIHRLGIRRIRIEVIRPIRQAVFLHPYRIVHADVRFTRVVAGQFDMIKTVPRPVELPPEVQIPQ